MNEIAAMKRAIELAWSGWGRVAPNPMVGAVLLRKGRVVGEGYHREWGGPHAEVEALAQCDEPAGTTLVLNLEPCNHQGKTPPCTKAVLEAGVTRVVAALRDPHPKARGGMAELERAGLDTELGLLEEEAAAQNAPFLCAVLRPSRPYLAVKLAVSVDGFIADHTGGPGRISGPESDEFVQWLRAGFDAIGVGRATAEIDDPRLTVRGETTPRRSPTRLVFSRSGAVRTDLGLFRTADRVPTRLVVTGDARAVPSELSDESVVRGDGMADVLARLRSEDLRSILVEGGGNLVKDLLQLDLVDRLYLIQAPLLLGGGTRAFPDRSSVPLSDAARWRVSERRALGRDNLLVLDRRPCLPEL